MSAYSTAVRTRAEMEAEYGAIPLSAAWGSHYEWTIHRSHASVTYVTDDGGEHWIRKSVVHAAERARRDEQAMEQARIQRELK